MAEKVILAFNEGLYSEEVLAEIRKELTKTGVEFESVARIPTAQASMLDHIIATYNLSPDFWNGVATTYAVDGANKAFSIAWRFTKNKVRTMIMSGQKKRLIKERFVPEYSAKLIMTTFRFFLLVISYLKKSSLTEWLNY